MKFQQRKFRELDFHPAHAIISGAHSLPIQRLHQRVAFFDVSKLAVRVCRLELYYDGSILLMNKTHGTFFRAAILIAFSVSTTGDFFCSIDGFLIVVDAAEGKSCVGPKKRSKLPRERTCRAFCSSTKLSTHSRAQASAGGRVPQT